ncbi:transcriptional regulator with XRE-family HTH domain [Phyllobacterium trifolii]|uniref:Transcriptional regulator with XRE-family HTH domain n=1 Tax=Phyllobacterium trifolii TaxID=300193 RepID=A0A839UET1_9HYPH|nr:helix-turn-helix domain-containing protein [Phyllobacterium trifolii]MBB3147211.1 transcriptional regulator with XRE-family HTH domain [Phyllobacterium trifolii]
MFAPYQLIRAARVALDLRQDELSERAGVSTRAVRQIENGYPVARSTMEQVQGALEEMGVTFVRGGKGYGPGMRLPTSIVARQKFNPC